MSIKKYISFYLFLLFICSVCSITAQVPTINFQSIVSGLSSPVDIANAGDGSNRLFFVEQTGTIRIYQNGLLVTKPFLNVTNIISYDGAERGLLSVAFHPGYKNNRYFFIYYTDLSGDITVARYQTSIADPNVADSLSGVVLLSIPKPYANHNGGKLNFGPDGDLYFGTGDGGSGGNPENTAQNLSSLLGKMLRINVDSFSTAPYYTIPGDNPYVSNDTAKEEIWDWGLRNPWRWSFDRQTGDMWLADVGQNKYEEVNFETNGTTGGLNFGWRCYEGDSVYNSSGCGAQSNYVFPIFTYPHNDTGGIAIVGGYIYRGTQFPTLQGYYLFTDYTSGNGWLTKSNGVGGWSFFRQTNWPSPASSFGEDESGELYLSSLNGNIYKLNVSVIVPLNLLSFTATKQVDAVLLKWTTANESNTKNFVLEYSDDGILFSVIATITANKQALNSYAYTDKNIINSNTNYYRLKIYNDDGSYTLSPIVNLNMIGYNRLMIYPTIVQDHLIHIYSPGNITAVEVLNPLGSIITKKQLNSGQSYIEIKLSESLSKGMYMVKLLGKNMITTEKIIVK